MKNLRKLTSFLLTAAVLFALFSSGFAVPGNAAGRPEITEAQLARIYDTDNYENDFVPGEVLVGMKYGFAAPEDEAALFPELNIVSREDLYQSVRDALPNSAETVQDARTVYLLKLALDTEESVRDAIEILKQDPDVAYAEPNYITQPDVVPNDPSYNRLWDMDKIQAPEAWDISTGSHSVQVGVLDSGFDYTHPDLAANIDRNLGYYPAQNTYGYAADIMDYVTGHGTHVAGTIGAVGNNGVGVVGVNWNVTIVPIKIALNDTTSSSDTGIMAKAVTYAAGLGLPVISMSYSSGYSQTLIDALSRYNGLFIKSAGNANSNRDTDYMFLVLHALGNVIFVANSQQNDTKSASSCYGANTVALAAPGTSIYNTYPLSMGGYATLSGTSMAAPHVAGAAALLLSHVPHLTTQQLKAAILDNVDDVPALHGWVSTGGRLNVYKAIQAIEPIQYTITYDANGGLNPPPPQYKIPGAPLSLSSAQPTREGYAFLGWSTDPNAGSAAYQPGGQFTADANTTLYAVWATLTLIASSAAARPGDTVTIDISAENNPGVKGFTLSLAYDSAKLEYVSMDTQALASLGLAVAGGNTGGVAVLSFVASGGHLLSDDGKLYSVTFKVRDAAPDGEIPLTLSGLLGDPSGLALTAGFVNGAVHVAGYKLGDINGDGNIDILDAILLQSIWLGDLIPTPARFLAADVNRDGVVDANDLVLLMQYIAGGYGVALE